jgi:hypothetical protein
MSCINWFKPLLANVWNRYTVAHIARRKPIAARLDIGHQIGKHGRFVFGRHQTKIQSAMALLT